MVLKNKDLKIGFIFGLKNEMDLLSLKAKKKPVCFGYGSNSRIATENLLKHEVDIVLNLGFAGSIKKQINNGDIVLIDSFFMKNEEKKKMNKSNQSFIRKKLKGLNFKNCSLLTVDKIITKKEKLKISQKHREVSIIDMEVGHIFKQLKKNKIPFVSIKIIFDDLSFNIPNFIRDCINENGDLKILRLLSRIILDPKKILDLLTLKKNYNNSKKVLKEVVNRLST